MQLTETPLLVELENENLEEVEELTDLGSIMSKSNATVKDITNRLQKAKSSFVQLNKVWRSPNISEKTKIKIYSSNVLSVLNCMVQNVGGLPKETAKDCQVFTLLA